ncbi:MAG: Ig-like domain-containing protein [Acidobacteria bacterium]|nr:Ig-like domain-containing protein [Acidobacteriota bacterium]
MKRIGAIVSSILILCVAFTGCGGGSSHKNSQGSGGTTRTLASITVYGANAARSVALSGTLQLTAQGNYSDGTTADLSSQVSWSSSDSSVAALNNTGLLTSYKTGSVIATATSGSVSGTLVVTINGVSTIDVVAPNPSLASGSTEQLTATAVFSDHSTKSITSDAAWQSSDNTVAVVSPSGLLTALKSGNVTVTATWNSISGNAAVSVTAGALSSITIMPAAFSVASGQSKQLSVLGVYADGTSQDVTSQAAWNSSTAAASVDSTGLVTGSSAGTSTITATIGSKSASALATVSAALLQTISVNPLTASIATGQTQAFTAYGNFSDGSQTDISNSASWASSATNYATVDPTGLATGVSAGVSTISASSGSATPGSAALTVSPAVLTEIDIAPDAQYIPVGGQLQLSLTGTYSDGSTQDITASATWSSSDSTLASVDPGTGIVSGVANSNNNPVTITATYGSISNTATVYVTDAVPVSIQLTPATSSIASGTTQQYSVNVVYSDGSLQPVTTGLSWLSSSASVAGVDLNGLATALAPGQTTITVFYDSMSATASLTVTPAVLTNIVVTPITTVVGVNGNAQFTANGVFSDNSTQDISSHVVWTSSNGALATINASGLATGVSTGTLMITATSGAISGSATLNVTTSTLQSITITPSNPILPPHSRTQLTAIGNFSDGSQQVLSGVSWHSNSPSVAMVNGSGVLRSKNSKNKSVTITAKLNGVSGTTSVTVTSMTIQTVAIQPANPIMATGTKLQLALIGTFSDGTTQIDLTASARWQTSNYADAVVNRQGVLTGAAAGSLTVTGSINGVASATTNVTVTSATVQSITVTPANPTIALGSSQQFAASGSFSDGSTQNISNVVTWSSSTPTVAIVNQSGMAASASHGTTNINATLTGITGSTQLTVN